ncbi:MAG: sugar phosphate isomerase/epimerase [Mariniphaga sp.]|nr:sugar phosphate isomerase/epimerase [Mariniphaga sp.]
MNRRQFSKNVLMTSAAISTFSIPVFSNKNALVKRSLKKSIMWGSIGVGRTILEKFQAAKLAGFDGVEVMSHFDRNEVLKARDATGLFIPSVCNAMHWTFLLSDPDPKVREEGVTALKVSLEDAKAYGADTVLLVPGRVSEAVSYDDCWKRSIDEIKRVVPIAEQLNVKIAIENVPNNFLLSPLEAVSYIDQFQSKIVCFYFDCGNIMEYGWPDQWIKILGPRIAKVHIKEYSRKIAEKQGRGAEYGVKLLEGDVNWPAVMKALDDIGYNNWTTIEQSGGDSPEGLKDLYNRLTKIHAS